MSFSRENELVRARAAVFKRRGRCARKAFLIYRGQHVAQA